MFKFRAIEDFHSDEFRSDYVNGLTYTVHDDNIKLANAVEKWMEEGKIELIGDFGVQESESSVSGIGTVS